MKAKATLCALAVIGVIASSPARAADESNIPAGPLTAARIFADKNCVRCHQIDVQLGVYGPDLTRVPLSGNLYDIVGRMWGAGPVMVGKMKQLGVEFPKLAPDQLVDVVGFIGVYQKYLGSYGKGADAAVGARMFKTARCSSCHSFSADANTTGPSLQRYRGSQLPLAVLRAMWLHSGGMHRAGQARGISLPRFSKSQIQHLLVFLSSNLNEDSELGQRQYLQPGDPSRGKDVFESLGCRDCHAVHGSGGHSAPDLGTSLHGRQFDLYSVMEALWNHSPKMWSAFDKMKRKRPNVSTRDLADLLGYLFFINFDQVEGNADQGKQLFEAEGCSACHESGDLAITEKPAVARVAILAAMWNAVPKMVEACNDQGVEWPKMMSGKDLSSLVEFLKASAEKPGH